MQCCGSAVLMWIVSCLLFCYVLASLWQMAASALRVKNLAGTIELFRLSSFNLQMILLLVVGSWLFFPIAILAFRLGMVTMLQAETILVQANFGAKVMEGMRSTASFAQCPHRDDLRSASAFINHQDLLAGNLSFTTPTHACTRAHACVQNVDSSEGMALSFKFVRKYITAAGDADSQHPPASNPMSFLALHSICSLLMACAWLCFIRYLLGREKKPRHKFF